VDSSKYPTALAPRVHNKCIMKRQSSNIWTELFHAGELKHRALIHGPPSTGKSALAFSSACAFAEAGESVLVVCNKEKLDIGGFPPRVFLGDCVVLSGKGHTRETENDEGSQTKRQRPTVCSAQTLDYKTCSITDLWTMHSAVGADGHWQLPALSRVSMRYVADLEELLLLFASVERFTDPPTVLVLEDLSSILPGSPSGVSRSTCCALVLLRDALLQLQCRARIPPTLLVTDASGEMSYLDLLRKSLRLGTDVRLEGPPAHAQDHHPAQTVAGQGVCACVHFARTHDYDCWLDGARVPDGIPSVHHLPRSRLLGYKPAHSLHLLRRTGGLELAAVP
jgi:hypothetical protein